MAIAAAGRPPVDELGHVQSSWATLSGWPIDAGEETPACAYPASVGTYNRMRRNSTIRSVLTALTGPLRRSQLWALDPQGARPEVVAMLAEDLDLPIVGQERTPPARRRGRFSWPEHVRLALLHLTFGHIGFETIYDDDALKATGQARLRKLAPRFPSSITAIETAADGNLSGIRQGRIQGDTTHGVDVFIPVDRLVWYCLDREGAAWQGQSVLRSAYGDWLQLERFLRGEGMLMERWGSGIPIAEAPPGADQAVIDLMSDIAQKARGGEFSGVGLPSGARLRFQGVEGTLPDIGAAIERRKASIADSVAASWMRLGTSEASGNRSLGDTFVEQFCRSQDAIAGAMADVATQHIVEDIVDLNWGEAEPAPAVVARPVDAETDIGVADLVELAKIGVVTADESLEDFARARYRLPRRTAPQDPNAPLPLDPVVVGERVDAAGALIRSGFKPDAALTAVGLDPIEHLGFLPVTLQSDPAAAPPPPAPTDLAAARRRSTNHGPSVHAATAKTWQAKVSEALAASVDAGAIAAARLEDGATPAAAVKAGLSVDATAALAAVLVDMWGDGYDEGSQRAADTAPKTVAARRPSVVVASLSDMVTRAGEIARGILSSLSDRLTAALDADDVPVSRDALVAMLDGLGADVASAERIAVNETSRAMTAGAVDTWAGMGITELRWVQTTDEDDECATLNGMVATEWDELPPIHPNCSCSLEPA